MSDGVCDTSSPSGGSCDASSPSCDASSPSSVSCDVSSPSDYSSNSDNTFQVHEHDNYGFSNNHGTVFVPVSSTSNFGPRTNGVKWFGARSVGNRYHGIIFFGLIPTIIGIVLLSLAPAHYDNLSPFFKSVNVSNPFTVFGSITLAFGLLCILGGLYGICGTTQSRQQNENTAVRLAPVVSGQRSLQSQAPSVVPQLQNAKTGQPPYIELPPPYSSKEAPPRPPTYQY